MSLILEGERRVTPLSGSEYAVYNQLKSEGMQIGVIIDPPYANPWFDPSNGVQASQNPGLGVEVTMAICQVLRIPCHFHIENTTYGDNMNGTWRGMVRKIMDLEYHTALPAFNPSPERLKVLDFSDPVYDESNLLITRFPEAQVSLGTVIFAFSWQVWLLLLATLAAIGILSTVFQHQSMNQGKNKFGHIFEHCFDRSMGALSMFVNQDSGESRQNYRIGNFVIFSVWGLMCVVLAGIFSGQIVALALAKKILLPFQDISGFAQCIEDGDCVMVTKSLSLSYFERIFYSEVGPLHDLNRTLKRVPPLIFNASLNKIDGILDKGDPRYRVLYASITVFAGMVMDAPVCSLDAVQCDSYDNTAFPLALRSPLKPLLNRALTAVREAGLIDKLFAKYVSRLLQGQERCKSHAASMDPMGLKAFVGTFALLAFGALIGVIILVLERLWDMILFRIRKKYG